MGWGGGGGGRGDDSIDIIYKFLLYIRRRLDSGKNSVMKGKKTNLPIVTELKSLLEIIQFGGKIHSVIIRIQIWNRPAICVDHVPLDGSYT